MLITGSARMLLLPERGGRAEVLAAVAEEGTGTDNP
jgi:hypothetical protein